MSGVDALHAHMSTGITTVARCWQVTRKDGVVLGFTDHDCPLHFEGVAFRADTGLSAKALEQSTGLAVDNTEALGALSDVSINDADIAAGRFDGAEVVSWLVNWADVSARKIIFRGHIGELKRGEGAFHAELRGLADALNKPVGRVFQRPCTAVLGDKTCRFAIETAGYLHEGVIVQSVENKLFMFDGIDDFAPLWFQRGRFEVVSGKSAGLHGAIKNDTTVDGLRVIELWEPIRSDFANGDQVRLIAGCDKRFETCRLKFANSVNFQGFPDIPEEDWMQVHATQATSRSGGSRR